MPCAFHRERLSPFDGFFPDCQFGIDESDLVEVDGKSIFNAAAFSRDAYFPGSPRKVSKGMEDRRHFHRVSFKKTRFERGADFRNRRFLDTTDFEEARFGIAPNFHNCELHQETYFTRARFEDTSSDRASHAYEMLSDYGQNALRPVIWLLALVAVVALPYVLAVRRRFKMG